MADYKPEQRKYKHGTMSEVAMSQLEEALTGQIWDSLSIKILTNIQNTSVITVSL